jgi:hypothetical protein
MALGKTLTLETVVQRNSDVIAAEAGSDLIMVSIENGLYYGVSDVAREIWELIERPQRISDIVEQLMGVYEIDRSSCEEDTLSFLDGLRAEGLLEVRDGVNA